MNRPFNKLTFYVFQTQSWMENSLWKYTYSWWEIIVSNCFRSGQDAESSGACVVCRTGDGDMQLSSWAAERGERAGIRVTTRRANAFRRYFRNKCCFEDRGPKRASASVMPAPRPVISFPYNLSADLIIHNHFTTSCVADFDRKQTSFDYY